MIRHCKEDHNIELKPADSKKIKELKENMEKLFEDLSKIMENPSD